MSFCYTMLSGRLGADPKSFDGATPFVKFSVAVDKFKGGQKTTEWWNVTCFGKNAEVAEKYLKKGSWVFIFGRPDINEYTDKQGVTRQSISVIADRIEFGGGGGNQQPPGNQPSQPPSSQPSPTPNQYTGIDEEDIPF